MSLVSCSALLVFLLLLLQPSCQRPPPYAPSPQFKHRFNISQPISYLQSKSPSYHIKSRFDFQSVNLALNQEWIELDLFHHGLAQFSAKEFEEAGLDAEDRFLIQFMADQEVSHATVLSNMLGRQYIYVFFISSSRAAKQCQYRYPFKTVKEFIDFCQKLTRWGESGVYGFLSFLENPNSAQILLQSIVTEARQQMVDIPFLTGTDDLMQKRCVFLDDGYDIPHVQIFRQFEGLFPMPIYHVPGIPQSWAWTLLHPYLVSCPRTNPYIEFDIFPRLEILNNPDPFQVDSRPPAITNNRTSLSLPGRRVSFRFEKPGKVVGPNGDYKTLSHSKSSRPKFAAWASRKFPASQMHLMKDYNVTYSKLEDVDEESATTIQPSGVIFPGQVEYPVINGTMFIVLTDVNPNSLIPLHPLSLMLGKQTDLHVTPSNISALNQHIVAGFLIRPCSSFCRPCYVPGRLIPDPCHPIMNSRRWCSRGFTAPL
ncbi:hypothetical protein VP01_1536g3 [Puccinia sorghi]|uniref:Uncharacterized protein n=1 Tax=Puccinia sorghi TaxID=27349 RepID=A0A0L6VKA9_9BASI|nr:hypothetical protein VP01_1536g3 [Puccinia sorghi]